MGLTVAFHTKGTQGTLHKTGTKDIIAKQDLLLRDSLHGSNAVFTEQQSDTKGTVTTVLDLSTWHAS